MNKSMTVIVLALSLAACGSVDSNEEAATMSAKESKTMELGNFCLCLSVKDLATSMAFYDKLGFKQVGGEPKQNWVVLANERTKIGLFQGMFEGNMLTFNPGWNATAQALDNFTDVREIQKQLKAQGVALQVEADEASDGPAHLVMTDPDGNVIMLDQHVPKP